MFGTVLVYFITAWICSTGTKGIHIKSEEALNDTVTVMKLIFTPVNALIILSTLGNVFGKMKDQTIRRRQGWNAFNYNCNCCDFGFCV